MSLTLTTPHTGCDTVSATSHKRSFSRVDSLEEATFACEINHKGCTISFHMQVCTPPVASCSAASAVNQTLLVKVAAVVASDDILCGVYSSACKCFDSILAQIEDLPVFSLLNEKNAPPSYFNMTPPLSQTAT